ncbi:MAG: hypothetical protein R3E02_04110 [Blastomonas sp.]
MKTIDQFMWGYQEHFRIHYEILTQNVFEAIGFEGKPKVFLVGLAMSDREVRHEVCVEPETGFPDQDFFSSLPKRVAEGIPKHPNQQMFYGDEVSNREKPENIHRQVITEEVLNLLASEDERSGLRSFASLAAPVDNYYVVTIIQVPKSNLAVHSVIPYRWMQEDAETNLLMECIWKILSQAQFETCRSWPEPGRTLGSEMQLEAKEIAVRAAKSLMRVPLIAGDMMNFGFFEPLEQITKLMYEGQVSKGRIVLAAADDPNVDYVLRFSNPVSLRQTRWLRKLLQMATRETALISGYGKVYGLGSTSDISTEPYAIDVVDRHQWDFRRGNTIYMHMRAGRPTLPKEPISSDRLKENMTRIFENISDASVARAKNVMGILFQLGRGSMIVFADDAAEEAERLQSQGTKIEPTALNKELLERATSIDGTIIADPNGVCHAVGIILDGTANAECTPERGSRYNSAVRYVGDGSQGRMAMVLSEDGTLDIIPLLRKQIDREEIEQVVVELEAADLDNYHKARNYLDKHRFYVLEDQCERINEALDRIESEPTEVGRIVWDTKRFTPNPNMNEGYFKQPKKGRE